MSMDRPNLLDDARFFLRAGQLYRASGSRTDRFDSNRAKWTGAGASNANTDLASQQAYEVDWVTAAERYPEAFRTCEGMAV